MHIQKPPRTGRYETLYRHFDSPLAQQIRREAYGEDIGQHSWVTAEELEGNVAQLRLSSSGRLLDLGCGPCGPLAFVLGLVRCHGIGIDMSAHALVVGRARATLEQAGGRLSVLQADLDGPLPLLGGSCDAVLALDVVLHVRDRARFFREAARVLIPGGRLLFTDAGILTGAISSEEIALRAGYGHTQFAPLGFNERTLEAAGFRVIDRQDRTPSLLKNAVGRLAARKAHRKEIEELEGALEFERQQEYLETVIALSERRSLARILYVGESCATQGSRGCDAG